MAMSIAAANLFTRNVYREYFNRDASPAQEARVSRLVSLVVKAGAVVVILVLDPQFSIDLQLIGGVIIVQTLPAVAIGLYTRALHAWGLLAGWAAGMIAGLYMLYDTPNAVTGKAHFGGKDYYGIGQQIIYPMPFSEVRDGVANLLLQLPPPHN